MEFNSQAGASAEDGGEWIYRDGQINEEWVGGSDLEDHEDFDEDDEEYAAYIEYLAQLQLSAGLPKSNETTSPNKKNKSDHSQQGPDGSTAGAASSSVGKIASTTSSSEATEYPDLQNVNVQEDELSDSDISSDEEDEVAPRYYDWREYFPEIQGLIDNYDDIVEEMKTLTSGRWCPWPEYKLYSANDQNGDWKVIPLMHTFPAWDSKRTKLIEGNCLACPKTMSLLNKIPGLRTVLFSRLGPRTRLSSHQGWADLANYVLRCHLPLVLPNTEKFSNSCGMWVEGEIQPHKERDVLVFDDSKMHKAFNGSDEERIILIFDLVRPESLPKGLATGGHTEQLDEFISQYEASIGVPRQAM